MLYRRELMAFQPRLTELALPSVVCRYMDDDIVSPPLARDSLFFFTIIRRLFRRLGHPAGFRDTLPPPRAPASGTALRSARRPSGKFSGSGVHGPEE